MHTVELLENKVYIEDVHDDSDDDATPTVVEQCSNGTDIVGDTEYPSAYVFHDSTANMFHVRLRLNSSPEGTGILAPYGWGLLVDTTGDFNSYEYSFMIDGSSETLHISQNLTPDRAGNDTLCPDASCYADDEIEIQITSFVNDFLR